VTRNDPPAAVLFDLDGTLVATRSLYLEAYRVAVEPFVRRDLTAEEIMALKPTSELGFIRAVVGADDVDACQEAFFRAYRDLHQTMFEGVFEGVHQVLAELRATGVPIGIVTGKSRRCWEVTRVVADLGPFDVLVFDDDVRAPKPDPHGLTLALRELDVPAARAVYVGDTLSDLRAARAAGMRPVTVVWARIDGDRADLARQAREGGAEWVLDRPVQLRAVLGLQ
jgi:pyrophosphatase PpaX